MKSLFSILLTTILLVTCCSSPDDTPEGNKDNFNRGALLTHVANNIIIPAYQDLDTRLSTLKSSKDAFISNTNQSNLNALRASWISAYKVWQHVEMLNIGKAEEILYGFQMNVYPTNTTDIENNIASGTYDLKNVNNNDAVGFPALDYLLFGIAANNTAILAKYSDTKYIGYLSDVVDQMKSLTEIILSDWKNTYKSTFISQTGNSATSALNKFTNDFVFYFEKNLRANKIGIPAGNFSATPLPDKVEGLYSKIHSKEFVLIALDAAQNMFNGKAYSGAATGDSFKSYLTNLNRSDLATVINNRFDDARQKIQALNDDFGLQIGTDNTKMTQAYDALQLVVVALKVDMLQAFNISVDYVDADGD